MKKRNSRLELLRIISILAVIALHAYRHASDGILLMDGFSVNHIILQLICSWGLVGVNCFFIISSFFLLDSNRINEFKLFSIILTTCLFSILIYILDIFVWKNSFSIMGIIKGLISPFDDTYWYITCYLLLYIIHSYLNRIIKSLNIKELRDISCICFVITFIFKTLIVNAPIGNIGVPISIYFIIAYYKVEGKKHTQLLRQLSMASVVCVLGCQLFVSILPEGIRSLQIIKYCVTQIMAKFSPFMLIIALDLFDRFNNSKEFHSAFINNVSTHILAVYVIHENDYLSSHLWNELFPIAVWYEGNTLLLIFKLCTAMLFVVIICCAFDFVFTPLISWAAKVLNKNVRVVAEKLIMRK